MTNQPKYYFQPDRHSIRVLDLEAKVILGRIDLPSEQYPVRSAEGKTVGVVNSINDAIDVLLDHYERHPPQWERDSETKFGKLTPFGLVEVEQDQFGSWVAYRNEYFRLTRGGKPVLFATADEAQRAADAHLRDELGKVSNDGFEWVTMD